MLNGRERERPGHDPLIGRNLFTGFHHFSKPGDRLVLKKMSWSDPQPGLTSLGNDLNAEDRIATQFEEVVLPTDLINAENLCPDLGQGLLDSTAGSLISRIELWPHPIWSWQGQPIDFAIGCHRQGVQHHEMCRHHIVRYALLQIPAESTGGHGLPRRDDIPHQAFFPGFVLPYQCHGRLNLRVLPQHRFNLA